MLRPTFIITTLCLTQAANTIALNKATEVKDLAVIQQKGTALLMKYFTPWCSHCRSLGPSLEAAKAAVEDWDSEDYKPTVFGEMDCEANPAACKKLGVVAFPSLKFYNNEGNAYLEYPRLPRTAEALTAYLARYRRVIRPYPIVLRNLYTEPTCSSSLRFKDSICRGFRIENYLTGGSEVFQSFNKLFKNAPTAFLEFIDDSEPANELCIVDRFTRERRYCLKKFDPGNQKDLEDLKNALLTHRRPYVIPGATWFDFFQLRIDTTGKRVVVVSPEGFDSLKKFNTDLGSVARELLEKYHFLIGSSETQGIFKQAGVSGGVLVFESSANDKGFYHLPSERSEELAKWLNDIASKKINKQFPPGAKSPFEDMKDALLTLPRVVISGISSLSLRRKFQLLLTGFGICLAWIYLVLSEDNRSTSGAASSTAALPTASKAPVTGMKGFAAELKTPASPNKTPAALPTLETSESKEASKGVCLINGEVTTPNSSENLPIQNE